MSYLRIRTNTYVKHNAKLQMDVRVVWRNGIWQRFDRWNYVVTAAFNTKIEAIANTK